MKLIILFLAFIFTAEYVKAEQACKLLSTDGTLEYLSKGEKASIVDTDKNDMVMMIYNYAPLKAEVQYAISRSCPDEVIDCQPLDIKTIKMGIFKARRIIKNWQGACLSIINVSISPEAKLGVALYSLLQTEKLVAGASLMGKNQILNQFQAKSILLPGQRYFVELWAPNTETAFIVATDGQHTTYNVRSQAANIPPEVSSTTKSYHTFTIEKVSKLFILNASLSPTNDSYFKLTDINCGETCNTNNN